MKLLFLFLLILPFQTFCQGKRDSIWRKDLVGIWQYETPVVGNGYGQIYTFYSDGSFELTTDSWDETSNNHGFKGHYKIRKGTQTLIITIDSTIQGKGCHYIYGDNPGGSSDWQFKCDTTVTAIYNSDDKTFEIPITWSKPDEKFSGMDIPLKCISMDDSYIYYKVSDKTEKK
jgi:hypothetical protein